MHHLVVGALQEGRVDRAERPQPLGRHAGGERHRVLLGDAHVEEAPRVLLLEGQETRRSGHGGGDGHDTTVAAGLVHQRFREDLGEGQGWHVLVVETRRQLVVVHLEGVRGGRLVAAALLGDGVDHDRPVPLGGAAQGGLERFDVVAVDGADVAHAQRLEEGVGGDHLAHHRGEAVDPEVGGLAQARQARHETADALAQREVGLVQAQGGEGRGQSRDGGRVAAPVVVEDDDDALAADAEVVEGLVGHSAGERAVAHEGDHVARSAVADELVARFEGHGEPVGVGERGRGVRGLDPVVLALAAVGVSGESAALAQGLEAVAASGEEFVDVGLVARVEEQDVIGGAKDPVQGEGQFHYAEVAPQVAAGGGHRRDDEVADLAAQLVEFLVGEGQEIGGGLNRRQNHIAQPTGADFGAEGRAGGTLVAEASATRWATIYFALWPSSSG